MNHQVKPLHYHYSSLSTQTVLNFMESQQSSFDSYSLTLMDPQRGYSSKGPLVVFLEKTMEHTLEMLSLVKTLKNSLLIEVLEGLLKDPFKDPFVGLLRNTLVISLQETFVMKMVMNKQATGGLHEKPFEEESLKD